MNSPTCTRGLLFAGLLALAASAAQANDADQANYDRAVTWLLTQQHENGGFGEMPGEGKGEIGITGIVAKALAGAPERLRPQVQPVLARAAEFLLAAQQADGSFVQGRSGLATYRTSVTIMALAAIDRDAYAAPLKRAVAFLKGAQIDEGEQVTPADARYGGFTYGPASSSRGGRGADLSNTHMALAALRDAGVAKDDPVYARVMTFLERCQNDSEVNDGVGFKPNEDSGFVYNPVAGGKEAASYAGMTYAGLLSLIYAGADEDTPSVKAALGWIAKNYTLERNQGLGTRPGKDTDQSGLYYYYYVFAKCLHRLGKPTVQTAQGERPWARDLLDALAARQRDDGSFVNSDTQWWENDPVLVTAYSISAMNEALAALGEGD